MIPSIFRELSRDYGGPVAHGAGDGDLTLTPRDFVALVVPPTSGTTTVTLPNVFDARGMVYSIYSNGDDTGVISVVGAGDELNAYTSSNLTADTDFVLLFSDGVGWYELAVQAT